MQTRACPACGSSRSSLLTSLTASRFCALNDTYRSGCARRLGVTDDSEWPIVRCSDCGFVYADLLPSDEFLRVLYEEVIDPAAAERESQFPSWVAHQLRLAAALLEALAPGPAPIRVLDFGCGYGTIVRALAGPNIRCLGFEPALSPRTAARAQGLEVFGTLEEIEQHAPFDAVILSDVLEHVPDPRGTLRRCHGLLAGGGWICVSVPDFSDARLRAVLGDVLRGAAFTRELNPWEHLNYFSPQHLAAMLRAEGFAPDPAAGPMTFGFRPETRGLRRWGNLLKSMIRMTRFAARPQPLSTTLLARKA